MLFNVELRREALHLNVRWPTTAASDCTARLRELSTDQLMSCVVQTTRAAHAHHGYLFANARATRIKLLVHDGFGVWCATSMKGWLPQKANPLRV